MELRQLRYFVAVADTLNFSRAAESMFVSQSSLSKQISDLEQELGVLLFRRSKHNVELTEAGLLLMDEAKAILLRSEKLAPLLQQADKVYQERSVFIGIDAKADSDPLVHLILARQSTSSVWLCRGYVRCFSGALPPISTRRFSAGN